MVRDVRLGRSYSRHRVSMVPRILSCPYPQGADGTPSTSLGAGGSATRTCARSRTRWRLRFAHRRRRSPRRQLLLPVGPERPLHIGPSTAHTFLRVNTTEAITHLDPVGCWWRVEIYSYSEDIVCALALRFWPRNGTGLKRGDGRSRNWSSAFG